MMSYVAGAWETYDIIDVGSGHIALKSHMNNDYLAADQAVSTSNPVRARSTSVGAWETWTIENHGGLYAFKNPNFNTYMSARLDQANAPLQALATGVGPWE